MKVGNSWDVFIEAMPASIKNLLIAQLETVREMKTIYPESNWFRCFKETDYKDVKVVLLGQD